MLLMVAMYYWSQHTAIREVVDNLEAAASQLQAKGAEFSMEPKDLRPGLRIAFVRAPGDGRIELLERSD